MSCLIVNANILVNFLCYETKAMRKGTYYLDAQNYTSFSKLVITPISKEEYMKCSGVNVIEDCSLFKKNRYYSLDIEVQNENLIKLEFYNLNIINKNTDNRNTYMDDNGNIFAYNGDRYSFVYDGITYY